MGEIISGVMSVVWFIIVFGIIKGYSNKNKGAGKRSEDIGRTITRVVSKLEKMAESTEDVSLDKSYDDDSDEAEIQMPQRLVKSKVGSARPAHAALRATSALSDTMTEDRQHDWLARQIRDERKHVVWNNFVDLGAAHDEACAAELNRMDHKRHHQSYVVDDGVSDN